MTKEDFIYIVLEIIECKIGHEMTIL